MGLRVRAKMLYAVNSLKASLDVGDYWYWLPEDAMTEDIPIYSMVYPLRYDILIRKSFFDLYALNRELYKDNEQGFRKLACEHVYYTWFQKVYMNRYRNDTQNRLTSDDIFARLIRDAACLYDNIHEHGFNTNFPIIPHTGKTIGYSTSGQQVEGTVFMGDGCHRLACLMSLGYSSLPRSFTKIKCFSRLSPFDNTFLLEPHLTIEWPSEYTAGNPAQEGPRQ